MGLTVDNWPAAVGIFTGVLAKEAVVGTLDAAYTALAARGVGKDIEEKPFDLRKRVAEAFATIPRNLADAAGAWLGVIGLELSNFSDAAAIAEKQKVSSDTFGAMAVRFDGAAGAFAYLLFVLLYFPCAAATAAIYQESGLRWTVFVVSWTTGLAHGVSTLFYQTARWTEHPAFSALWIGSALATFAVALWLLKRYGERAIFDDIPLGNRA